MKRYFENTTSPAPLAFFRAVLGILLFAGIVRFWLKGWIDELYVAPKHYFTFYGFEFISPLGQYTYLLFAVCALASVFVALGLYYRVSIVALFLTFTYIELIDKSTYLNHYYFISMVLLLMMFLPANVCFSLDAQRKPTLNSNTIPRWCVDSIRLWVCMIYVFAGLAKINTDWLVHALPLKIWLPAKNDIPLIGPLLGYTETAFVFSWLGCLYDLCIPFLLLARRTRGWAFAVLTVFHLLTAVLFPIGMFPYIMIVTALIFFPAAFHERVIRRVSHLLRIGVQEPAAARDYTFGRARSRMVITAFVIFFVLQAFLPLRHHLYPGELFWTEQGYRFSWRVMLMEKAGYAQFTVSDRTGRKITVDNSEFLTPLQEKMMATQPDMILQYAHVLRDHYRAKGFDEPEVYVDAYVTVNGRLGTALIDPRTDLAGLEESFTDKSWILPYNEKIKGF